MTEGTPVRLERGTTGLGHASHDLLAANPTDRHEGYRISPKHKQSTRVKCTLSRALAQHRPLSPPNIYVTTIATGAGDYAADATMLPAFDIDNTSVVLARETRGPSPLPFRNKVDVKSKGKH